MKIEKVKIHEREFIMKIGQNAKENWNLIDESDDWDLWFHIDDLPSAHVIVQEVLNKKNKINYSNEYFGYPKELIILCGQYCKFYTKIYKKVLIVFTIVQNITKGKEIGSVFINNTKTIKI